jgi:hypothetical protein
MLTRTLPFVLALLCLLSGLNAIALIVNLSQPSRAAVGGMSYQDLVRDPDFTRAVKSIAQECKVNVDIAKLSCWLGPAEIGAHQPILRFMPHTEDQPPQYDAAWISDHRQRSNSARCLPRAAKPGGKHRSNASAADDSNPLSRSRKLAAANLYRESVIKMTKAHGEPDRMTTASLGTTFWVTPLNGTQLLQQTDD